MRLFVALPLPDEVRAGLARWVKSCGAQPGLRWTPVEQLHFTLHFLGEVADDRVAAITTALGRIEAPAFPVAFDRIETLGRGVLAAAAQATPSFTALAECVRSKLTQFTADSGEYAPSAVRDQVHRDLFSPLSERAPARGGSAHGDGRVETELN
jgi:2'-5' RNA ligase